MKQESEIRKVLGNSFWVMAAKILNIIVGLFASICVTRYLGAEQKGIMADASAISTLFGFIAAFGLIDIVISKFAEDYENSGAIACASMFLTAFGGFLAFVLTVSFAYVVGVSTQVFWYTIICALPYLYYFLSVFEYWFYSRAKSKTYAISQSIIHIVFMAVRLAGVPLKAPLSFFVIIIVLEDAVVKLSAILCYRKNKDFFVGRFCLDFSLVKQLAILSFPMLLSGFASAIYLKIDQIMIGRLLPHADLGVYSIAVTLAEYWYFVPLALYNSFLPALSKSADNQALFEKKLQKFADIQVTIGYLAVIGVMIFGKIAISIMYGPEFEKSAIILMVYIWSGIFTCLALSGTAVYVINKDSKTVLYINLAGAVINFVLNIVFINMLGIVGAALATLIEYALVSFGQMVVLRKKYGRLYSIQLKALFPFQRMLRYIKEYRTMT